MDKYYFITIHETIKGSGVDYFFNTVIDIHPFKWQFKNKTRYLNSEKVRSEYNSKYHVVYELVLISFQEISKVDYDYYLKLQEEDRS